MFAKRAGGTTIIPRWLSMMIILLTTMSVLVAATVYMSQAALNGRYHCLRSNNYLLMDIWSGLHAQSPQPTPLPPTLDLLARPAWSWVRYKDRFAYLEYYRDPAVYDGLRVWLVIRSPDEGIDVRFGLPERMAAPQIVWTQDSRHANTPNLSWSPDGRYVLLQYYDHGAENYNHDAVWHFDVYSVEGDFYRDLMQVAHDDDLFLQPRAVWSSDGGVLLFWREQLDGQNAVAFHVDEQRYETVVSAVGGNISYLSRSQQRIALPWRRNGRNTITIMDMDGQHQIRLVENADDASDPSWSPDGQKVAVIWATGQGTDRAVRLTWADADGSNRNTLEAGFWDVRDLQWIDGGKALAFVARRRDGYGLEMVDIMSGEHRRLIGGLMQIVGMEHSPGAGLLSFWWYAENGDLGIDSFNLEGHQVQHQRVGVVSSADPYRMLDWWWGNLNNRRVFRSPNGDTFALKLGRGQNESLHLVPADGGWMRVVRSGLSGLGDPVWSPDGTTVAFTQAVGGGPVTLETVSADGFDGRRFDQPYIWNLVWTPCYS